MLVVSNVSKKYKDNIVLDNVNLSVEPGTIAGVRGPNGSGKSTLLSIISSVLLPDSGDVSFNGKSVFKFQKQCSKLIGFVPQYDCLFLNLSVIDNIKFWAAAYNVSFKNIWSDGAISCVLGLSELKNKKVNSLSGGMKRRVSIASSLVHSPEFIVLDEPCSGVDDFFKNRLLDYLKLMKSKGKIIIYSSHDPLEISSLCDDVYDMNTLNAILSI